MWKLLIFVLTLSCVAHAQPPIKYNNLISETVECADPVEPAESVEPAETPDADQADKVARSVEGKLIRIVGTHYDREAEPSDTSLGYVVEVEKTNFTKHSLCHVLLKGMPVLDEESGKYVPFIPEMFSVFGQSPASWPVKLEKSCRAGGCYWVTLMHADDCLKVVDVDGYQASTMKEMLNLYPGNLAERGRFLWTTGLCTDSETKKTYECPVPINDARVIAGRVVKIMHGWAGRGHDLGFATSKDDQVLPRLSK